MTTTKQEIIESGVLDKILEDCSDNVKNGVKSYISSALNNYKESILGEIDKKIRHRLDYCLKQNGLPHCKNCGLNKKDLTPK